MSKRLLGTFILAVLLLTAGSGVAGYMVGSSEWARWRSYKPVVHMYNPGNSGSSANPKKDLDDMAAEMIIAASDGDEASLRSLATKSYLLNYKPSAYCYNALLLAVLYKQAGAVKVLLAAGADRSIRDCKDRTAIDIAKEQKDEQIIELLESH